MKRILATLGAFFVFASADCYVDYEVLYLIAQAEKHPKKNVGYPHLISFNNQKDMKKLRKANLEYIKLDNRSIDCLSLENCVNIYNFLKKEGVRNLDLGAFQINPIWHKYEDREYFSLKHSINIACNILMDLGEQKGWSWGTLASYHSSTPKFNKRYKQKLMQLAGELE